MTDFVKAAAFAAKTSLSAKGIKVQHGIALEVVAAFLGYKTYAAFVVEERREDLKHHLADAEVIVLDYQGGVSRLAELEVLQAFIVQDFIDAIVNCRDGVFSDLPECKRLVKSSGQSKWSKYDQITKERLASLHFRLLTQRSNLQIINQ